jgi:hypothetical protein
MLASTVPGELCPTINELDYAKYMRRFVVSNTTKGMFEELDLSKGEAT